LLIVAFTTAYTLIYIGGEYNAV